MRISPTIARAGLWVGCALLLGLTAPGCPDSGASEAPDSPGASPVEPWVPAALPPDTDPLFGKEWQPVKPSAAMATVTLNADGSGEHGQYLVGRRDPTRVAARWERTEKGLRLTVSGKTTTYFELRYGTQGGEPRLHWDGLTYHRAIADAGFEKYQNPKGEVLLRLRE